MGESRKDPAKKGDPAARSLSELMELLVKLNSKIREKVSPRPPKEDKPPGNMEMVIIILNRSSANPPKASRREKPPTRGDDWIDGLCEEIQREGRRGRKPA